MNAGLTFEAGTALAEQPAATAARNGRRILWVLPYLPWPITSGGKARQFHLIAQMAARGHAITLLAQSKTPLDDAGRRMLEPLLERLIVLPRRPLRSARTLAAALISPAPLLASVNGHAPALTRQFEALLDELWDVVQIEHSYGAQPFLDALRRRERPFVLTEHNVESALGGATYGKWPRWLRPFAAFDRWRQRRWERVVLSQAERVIAVTQDDASALASIGQRPTDVVGNGVAVREFAAVTPDAEASRVLFVGNFEYAPNIDAVEWALEAILPRVWQQLPEARFAVCGHALPASWREQHTDPRIEWHGYVERLQDMQARSSVFLAPLRHGGGSKLKVMEAMAAGLPVVSTRQGVSGLAVRVGVDALVNDDAAALADAIALLLGDPARAARIGEAGRAYVSEHHDWPSCAEALEAVHGRVAPTTWVSTCA